MRFLLGWVPSFAILFLWKAFELPNTWTTSGLLFASIMASWFAGYAYRAAKP